MTKECKKQTDPALDLAPAVSNDEELTPEEVQMVCGDVECICIVDKVHLGPQKIILDQHNFKSPTIKKKLNLPGLLHVVVENGCILKEGCAIMKYYVFENVQVMERAK